VFRALLAPACCAVIVSLAACGSAPENPTPVVFDACQPLSVMLDVDENGSARAERDAAVEWAVTLWKAQAVTRLSSQRLEGAPALTVRFQKAALVFRGFYDDTAGVVFINDALLGHERAVTLAHEIGHALGLPHVEGNVRPSVMNKGNLDVEPTSEDAGALASLWGSCD
jgi:hypothetical protein